MEQQLEHKWVDIQPQLALAWYEEDGFTAIHWDVQTDEAFTKAKRFATGPILAVRCKHPDDMIEEDEDRV